MTKGDKRVRELDWDRGMPIAETSRRERAEGRSAVLTRTQGGFRALVMNEGGEEIVYRIRTDDLGAFLAQLAETTDRQAGSNDREDACDQTILFAVDGDVDIGTPTPPPPDPVRPFDDRLRRTLFLNLRNMAVDLGRLVALDAQGDLPKRG